MLPIRTFVRDLLHSQQHIGVRMRRAGWRLVSSSGGLELAIIIHGWAYELGLRCRWQDRGRER